MAKTAEATPPSKTLRLEIVNGKTILGDLREFLPECYFEQTLKPQLPTVICLDEDGSCDKGATCMPALARRAGAMFATFSAVKMVVLFFERRQDPDRLFAVVIPTNFAIRIVRCNKSAVTLLRKRAKVIIGAVPSSF